MLPLKGPLRLCGEFASRKRVKIYIYIHMYMMGIRVGFM